MGVPPNHLKLDHFSIETYGFGDPTLLRSLRMYILYTHTLNEIYKPTIFSAGDSSG